MRPNPQNSKKGSATFDRSEPKTKSFSASSESTISAVYGKGKPQRLAIRVRYLDHTGVTRIENIIGQRAKVLVHLWKQGKAGTSQAQVPTGFTLKEYAFRLDKCHETALYIQIRREWLPGLNGNYRRYWLETELTFLDQRGFPELASHVVVED